ncbi:hypothetical protein LSH36_858g00031 [Paralvinella palmiformis]|uniref:Outer dense fiber protein 3 n=1 Tax=Paralvinella palmiformis TaxID=53620 RepID=A0AAD9IZ75_9ANNE|nr:hypothetical protein LSH36_858g00031 [Paralvinella palmiformis]
MSAVYEHVQPRVPIAAMYGGPGPCYGLPTLVGQAEHDPRSTRCKAPAFIFGIRHGKLTEDCSPGPAYLPEGKIYKDGKDGTPHYSLYSRPRDQLRFNTPGPGAYTPENCGQAAYRKEPAYSFGSRTTLRRNDRVPAPNAYTLDSMLSKTVRSSKRQAPTFIMTGKNKVGSFCEDLPKTPGPGAYGVIQPDIYKTKTPSYSMTARNIGVGDNTRKPGPGAHSPEKVIVNKRAAPQFSFGIRHSSYITPIIVQPE